MKKICVFVLLCFCSVLFVGCGCFNDQKKLLDVVNPEDLSAKFFDDQMLDLLEIKNFNIAVEDNQSYISFDLTNTANEATTIEYIKIIIYDKYDDVLLESYGHVGGTLVSTQMKHIVIGVDIDLSKAVRVSYERM